METMKPFKSERAAKMAYTKAENAWREALNMETSLIWERRRKMEDNGGSMASEEYQDYERRIEAAKVAHPPMFEKMRAIYDQAKAQGFFVKS